MTFAVIGPSSFGATPAGAATISAAATTATRIARAPAAGAAHPQVPLRGPRGRPTAQKLMSVSPSWIHFNYYNTTTTTTTTATMTPQHSLHYYYILQEGGRHANECYDLPAQTSAPHL